MATTTPSWTDNVTLQAITTLARNSVGRVTFDWRTKWGGYVFVMLGRGGTTALSVGIPVLARRTLNNNGLIVPAAPAAFLSQTAAAVSTTCAASGNNAGVTSLTVASTASFAAGDLIFINGTGGSGNSEWCRVANIFSATIFTLDSPTKLAHNNVSDTVRNKAESWMMWLEGGATYELIVDYGAPTTGDTLTWVAYAQTFDSTTTV